MNLGPLSMRLSIVLAGLKPRKWGGRAGVGRGRSCDDMVLTPLLLRRWRRRIAQLLGVAFIVVSAGIGLAAEHSTSASVDPGLTGVSMQIQPEYTLGKQFM